MQSLLLPLLRLNARDEWRNAHSCDAILTNSLYSRESILRAYGYDARVCYPGIDTRLFRDLGLPRENFIVGMAALDRAKAIELAIEAVARLSDPKPPLVWIANAGDPVYEAELKRLAKNLGVDFQLKQGIPDAEVVDILNRAALMLYTSRLEPFGLAPLEAAACGTPSVAVAEGGVRETILDGRTGLLTDRDAGAIAKAVQTLLSDPLLARELGENAAQHARENWDIEKSISTLESLLRQVAGVKRG